ncbi:uncharacterized protein LOC111641223 [Centruroides sculpturatus]|uniref:uncharacterized protein LOC111641223 n=1 Tax=Centruroides sculpturatus TaxID=218467 RepID=UPI000C6D2174|nr:uncharacterized protein LOC111641223 [Centruroides sculpturatus]
MAIFGVMSLIGSLTVSWALSYFTSIIYDNFIIIGKYNSSLFTPEYRYKIICLIKRFGGRPFGLSMWGFFYIKRNFLLRMIIGLYSVFSSIIQITGVLDKKRCQTKTSGHFTFKNDTLSLLF